jgi:hypothetical protein
MFGGFENTSKETVMADDITWPLQKFCFSVQLGDDKDVTFQDVTGLQAEGTLFKVGLDQIAQPLDDQQSLTLDTKDAAPCGNQTACNGRSSGRSPFC